MLVGLSLVCFVHRFLGGEVCTACGMPVPPGSMKAGASHRLPTQRSGTTAWESRSSQTAAKAQILSTGNEEYLKALFDAVHTGILVIDPAMHRIIDVNPSAARMIGLPREQIVGSVCHRFVCPAEEGKCPVTDLGQAVHQSERVLCTADGREIPIVKTVVPASMNGRSCLIESFVDISEQKRIQRAIEDSEQRTRELADSLPQIVFETDVVGKITFSNRRGLEVLQYTQEDLARGINALDMFIPEDQERIQKNIIRILKGEILPDIEYTARRKDGRTFPVIINAAPIIRGGRAAGIRGIIVDISDIKRTETALRESEAMYRAIFEGTGTAMVIIEEDTTISLVNTEFEKFTGPPGRKWRAAGAGSSSRRPMSCIGSRSIMTCGASDPMRRRAATSSAAGRRGPDRGIFT